MGRLRSWAWCVPLLAVAWGAIGCNGFEDYCEKALDCRNHNDADVEACMINNGAEEEIADLNGCTEQYEAAFACRDEKGRCIDSMYQSGDLCEAENNRLNECVN